jgi:hypothetical protein
MKTMNKKILLQLISGILFLVGSVLIIYNSGWILYGGIFILLWGNNLSKLSKGNNYE